MGVDPHEWTDAWTRHQSRRTLALLMGELDALDTRLRHMEQDREKLLREIRYQTHVVRRQDAEDQKRERLLLRASLAAGQIPPRPNGKQ